MRSDCSAASVAIDTQRSVLTSRTWVRDSQYGLNNGRSKLGRLFDHILKMCLFNRGGAQP